MTMPVLGGTAPPSAHRTASKLGGFALRCCEEFDIERHAYLDVGCGNGFITRHVGQRFDEVHGIDVEPDRLNDFRVAVAGDRRFTTQLGSSATLPYPDATFDLVTAFEVLEHVADVPGTIAELARVVRKTGLIVVTTPQPLFPLETHGMRWRGREIERKIPLLPYIPPLHQRLSLARVFRSSQLDKLFAAARCASVRTGYAAPQFERSAANPSSWEARVHRLRPFLDGCESVPVLRGITGVSILKAYRPL